MFNYNYAELHIGLYIGFISREKDINYYVFIFTTFYLFYRYTRIVYCHQQNRITLINRASVFV